MFFFFKSLYLVFGNEVDTTIIVIIILFYDRLITYYTDNNITESDSFHCRKPFQFTGRVTRIMYKIAVVYQ